MSLPLVREDFNEWCESEGIKSAEEKTRIWRHFWAGWDYARDRVDIGFTEPAVSSEE